MGSSAIGFLPVASRSASVTPSSTPTLKGAKPGADKVDVLGAEAGSAHAVPSRDEDTAHTTDVMLTAFLYPAAFIRGAKGNGAAAVMVSERALARASLRKVPVVSLFLWAGASQHPLRLAFTLQFEDLFAAELGAKADTYKAYYKLVCGKTTGLTEKFSSFRKSMLRSLFCMSHLIFSHLSAERLAVIQAAVAPLDAHEKIAGLSTADAKVFALEINAPGTTAVYEGSLVRLSPPCFLFACLCALLCVVAVSQAEACRS